MITSYEHLLAVVTRVTIGASLAIALDVADARSAAIPHRADRPSAPTGRKIPEATRSRRVAVGIPDRPTIVRTREVWHAGVTYELNASVIVAAGGTLVIEAGARVEGRPGAFLDVTCDGRIVADGTPNEPIVLTCSSAVKYEGCWGGLTVRGFGRINYGVPTSPADRGSGAINCLQAGNAGAQFGGCDDADSSGVMRYLLVEYASSGVQLLGAGQKTVVDFVQVNRSRGDGLTVVGGAVDLRHIFLTASLGYGLSWRSGWRGRAQFVAIVQDALQNRGGILGSNAGASSTSFGTAPRSAPELYNVTIVAPSDPANPNHGNAAALRLAEGTSGTIRNVLIYRPHVAFDLDDELTCIPFGQGEPASLANVLVAGATTVGSGDADPSCLNYVTPSVEDQWLTDPANQSLTITNPADVAALLGAGLDLVLPDLRPKSGSSAVTLPPATPPSGGFFDPLALFAGAMPPATASRGNVPWYSGWTVPAPALPPGGSVSGVVASSVRGAMPNAIVQAAYGASTTSGASGLYTLPLPAGTHTLSTSALPQGCGAAPIGVTIASGAQTSANIAVNCTVVTGLSVGATHACGNTQDFRTLCWGANDNGMVGDGTTVTPRVEPVLTLGGLSFSQIVTGYSHTCGLTLSGYVFCWGLNAFGAAGIGSIGDVLTSPTAVSGAIGFGQISAGGYHTCGLTPAGEAYCWGMNFEGQIGTGVIGSSVLVPTRVSDGGLRFTNIAAGESHTCALTSVGAAYCWGGNGRGELGADPALVGFAKATPFAVPGGFTFASLDAGEVHTCGVTAAGAGVCWGSREFGQLGDGVIGGIAAGPTLVSGGLIVAQIAAGGSTTCAVTAASVAYCWGAGESGALGNGTFALTQSVPSAVSGGLSIARLAVNLSATGAAVACGIATVGDVFCWGAGEQGQLGDGSFTPRRNTPTLVKIPAP